MPLATTTLVGGLVLLVVYLMNRRALPRVIRRSDEAVGRTLTRANGLVGGFGVMLVFLGVLFAIIGLR